MKHDILTRPIRLSLLGVVFLHSLSAGLIAQEQTEGPEWQELTSEELLPLLAEAVSNNTDFDSALKTSLACASSFPENVDFRIQNEVIDSVRLKRTLTDLKAWNSLCKAEACSQEFAQRFRVFRAVPPSPEVKSRITGYFDPELPGATAQSKEFPIPVYSRPSDLIEIDLRTFLRAPEMTRLYGRVSEGHFLRYYSRSEILKRGVPAKALFFLAEADYYQLALQGSGTILFPDGKKIHVAYDGDNGHPFQSVHVLLKGKVQLRRDRIKRYMAEHPEQKKLWDLNPRYIFFREDERSARGICDASLTAERSIAYDDTLLPPGMPGILMIRDSGNRRAGFIFIHDTGSAIRGHGRVDLFLGSGDPAETRAMTFKHTGDVFFILSR